MAVFDTFSGQPPFAYTIHMLICKSLLHPAQTNYCQLLPFAFHIFVRNAFADMWEGGERGQRVSFLSLTANF